LDIYAFPVIDEGGTEANTQRTTNIARKIWLVQHVGDGYEDKKKENDSYINK